MEYSKILTLDVDFVLNDESVLLTIGSSVRLLGNHVLALEIAYWNVQFNVCINFK